MQLVLNVSICSRVLEITGTYIKLLNLLQLPRNQEESIIHYIKITKFRNCSYFAAASQRHTGRRGQEGGTSTLDRKRAPLKSRLSFWSIPFLPLFWLGFFMQIDKLKQPASKDLKTLLFAFLIWLKTNFKHLLSNWLKSN